MISLLLWISGRAISLVKKADKEIRVASLVDLAKQARVLTHRILPRVVLPPRVSRDVSLRLPETFYAEVTIERSYIYLTFNVFSSV
jgi:hypothetical protein